MINKQSNDHLTHVRALASHVRSGDQHHILAIIPRSAHLV